MVKSGLPPLATRCRRRRAEDPRQAQVTGALFPSHGRKRQLGAEGARARPHHFPPTPHLPNIPFPNMCCPLRRFSALSRGKERAHMALDRRSETQSCGRKLRLSVWRSFIQRSIRPAAWSDGVSLAGGTVTSELPTWCATLRQPRSAHLPTSGSCTIPARPSCYRTPPRRGKPSCNKNTLSRRAIQL